MSLGLSPALRRIRHGALLAVLVGAALLQTPEPARAAENRIVTRHGFTLDFQDLTGEGDQAVVDRLTELFFDVYPRLVAEFNPGAPHTVVLAIDPEWKGVAAASGNRIMFNPDYLKQRPQDIDALTHELMHVVQAYQYTEAPGWLVEGIADYVRDRFGVDNAAADWRLEAPMVGADYTQGYRVTGAFLRWVEADGRPGFVRDLNTVIREKTYDASTWRTLAGKSVEDLWVDYAATEPSRVMPDNPQLTLLTPEQLQRLHQFTPEQLAVLRTQGRGTAMEAQINAEMGAPGAPKD